MKKPKVEAVKLPYQSAIASFFNDQGGAPGSFLSKFFKGGGGASMSNPVTGAPAAAKPVFGRPLTGTDRPNGSGGMLQ